MNDNNIITIEVPTIGTSDNEVTVQNINFTSGDKIDINDNLASVETSKADEDIISDNEGYIYINCKEGDLIQMNSIFCFVSRIELGPSEVDILLKGTKSINHDTIRFTKKALKLISDTDDIALDNFPQELVTEKTVRLYMKSLSSAVINYAFNENDVIIYGIGGHASMCIDILNLQTNYNLVGFVDDNITDTTVNNMIYFGKSSDLDSLLDQGLKNVVLGIGMINNLKKRNLFYQKIKLMFNIPSIVHPSAIIEKSAVVSNSGVQIMAGAIIGSNVIIEENTIINCGAIISHDSIVNESSHITPGAILAGNVNIGRRVTIGMGSSVYFGIRIGDDKVINNLTSVIENII
jgi:UDP-perosamine 4-acetyltransferase